jgi:hypothetical protein
MMGLRKLEAFKKKMTSGADLSLSDGEDTTRPEDSTTGCIVRNLAKVLGMGESLIGSYELLLMGKGAGLDC